MDAPAAASPGPASAAVSRDAGPAVSVLACTRNRCSRLAGLLAALARQRVPAGLSWEVVVVDNGSTDDTPAVLEVHRARLPLRIVREPRAGISRARNAGLAVARGRIVAFTDDDCVPEPDWVARIYAELLAHPALDGVGGRVELYDPSDAPVSVRTSLRRQTFDDPGRLFTMIPGCNMAVRREVVDRVGGFDPRMGAGARVAGAEDSDFLYRVQRAGFCMDYVPEIVVRHHHGRRDPAQLRALGRSYVVGRGGLYAKHALRGDGTAMRLAWWEMGHAASAARAALRDGRPLAPILTATAQLLWGMLLGVSLAWGRADGTRVHA
jgi:glycosyltransferase involved in cell wall biosynthesis